MIATKGLADGTTSGGCVAKRRIMHSQIARQLPDADAVTPYDANIAAVSARRPSGLCSSR
jgi:hypothetical protein